MRPGKLRTVHGDVQKGQAPFRRGLWSPQDDRGLSDTCSVEAREWRWVSACALLLLALMAVPYGFALLRPPDGFALARTLYYGNDLSQYLAAMSDGQASSSWLIQDHLTSEPHSPALMYPLYVAAGKLAGLLGMDPLWLFSTCVVLSAGALVFAGYAFAATFLDSVRERRMALLLLLFASGLGIWIAAVTATDAPTAHPRLFAFDRAEVSTFLLPFGPPHLPLAMASLLLAGRALAAWSWGGPAGWLAVLSLAVLGIALANPFSLASLVAVSTGYALVKWVRAASFPYREAVAAVLVAAVSAPLMANSLLTFGLDPFWGATYGRQNLTGSPPAWVLGIDLGVLVPLALVGALWSPGRRESRLFLAVWTLTLLAMMYLPVPFQRRFGFGLQPAVAVLAALGLGTIGGFLRRARARAVWRAAFLGLTCTLAFTGTALGFANLVMASFGSGGLGRTVFEPLDNFEAANWLALHSRQEDVVLSSLETGNFLAGKIRGRVVLGHYAGTLDASRKEGLVRSFFDPTATPRDRRRIVAEGRVTYVFLGARERALGGEPLTAADGFRLVYETGGVRIYRVERSPS